MVANPGGQTPPPSSSGAAPRVRVFIGDQDSETVIRQCLGDLGVEDFVIVSGNVKAAAAALAKQSSPRLLIVDTTGVDDPVACVEELSEVLEPETSVLAVGTNNDISLYRQLKHAGVIEYFFKPLIRDQIVRSCHDILTNHLDQPSLYAGNLIFAIGVRGGVGATTIATNIAWYLAETRQRWTVLLDLDVQGGDAALQLDAAPGRALREAFEHPERVDKLFLERGATRVVNRLNLMASLEPLNEVVEGSEDAVKSLLENLLRRYRVVIVDIPANIATLLPQVLQMPSTCLLVANASLTAARDMARWREHIGPNTRERHTLSVLNHTAVHGGLPDAEFARAAGQAPDVVIPYDREAAEAANFGTRAIQKCAGLKHGLVHLLHHVTGEPIEKPASMIKRMFRR